jgi:MSHA biogenesis protein MshQ
MMPALARALARWLCLALLLVAGAARADTPLALYKSFAGNVNFTGTQVSMRKNNKPCSVMPSTANLNVELAGIPAGATVVSAQLYWAGSNSRARADYSVVFDGQAVSAPAGRQYVSSTIGAGYDYFSGAVDVTARVAAKGNGSYSFSGLTVYNGNPYCSVDGVVGGYALLVVYSSPAEPFRVLNLYEGFQYFRNSGIDVKLGNFKLPPTLDDSVTARLAHITWEGDVNLNQGGEALMFNGAEMTDWLNPSGNQFNSKSNINGDPNSRGVDFDAYTIKPSSGLIKPGQTSAVTRYQSGQDMVLLNAEIVAVPNMPTADLSLTMTRGGPLTVGADTAYTLNVANAGPSVENGPVTVTDTVPAGMTVISAGGSGWSCAVAGQGVTCSAAGSLSPGAALAPLTLVLRPTAPGGYTNTATVSGQMFDNIPANNTASDTATATTAGAAAYAFTTTPCAAGASLGGSACQAFTGPATAGAETPLYVTALSGSPAVATPPGADSDTPVQLRFALGCVDPARDKGVAASFAGVALPACVADGATPDTGSSAWSAPASLVFAAGQASAQVTAGFKYEDVGLVALHLLDPAGRQAAASFVVKPANLAFYTIRRTSDGAPNPAPATPRPGFVRAGEKFTLVVGARTRTGKWAPNFGNENNARWWPQIRLEQVQERELPALQGAFESASGGYVTGTGFWWDEAGELTLAPVLNDYLGAGKVDGTQASVGRFYPAWFTTAAFAPFACMKAMACPAPAINGGAYSAEPFKVEVTAMGLTGKPLSNYVGATITLSAIDSPGGFSLNPRGGSLSANSATSGIGDPAATVNPLYVLPAMFSSAQPHALNWTAPAAIYLRASVTESVVDSTGVARSVAVTSMLPSGSVEAGIMIVNGRLQLANAFGSELLKLPVRMNAQYWTGSAWDGNSNDNDSDIAYAGHLVFSDCSGALATGAGSDNCNSALLAVPPAPPLSLQNGAASFWLPAPGRGKTGSAYLRIGDDQPRWLPSTRARASFGLYKSPFIYMREVH